VEEVGLATSDIGRQCQIT